MIKAVIFDFDGVIVESTDIKTSAFAQLFENEGEDIVRKVVSYHLQHAGVSRFDKIRYIYEHFLLRELTEKRLHELCLTFSKLVVDKVVNAAYVGGAKEFLEDCSRLYKCFVSSATPQEEIEAIIRRRDMQKYFIEICGSPTKKSDIVRRIMQKNNFNAPMCVYVGDAMSDYEAARANGIRFIARINDNNEHVFEGVDCMKMNDLRNLKNTLLSLDFNQASQHK